MTISASGGFGCYTTFMKILRLKAFFEDHFQHIGSTIKYFDDASYPINTTALNGYSPKVMNTQMNTMEVIHSH